MNEVDDQDCDQTNNQAMFVDADNVDSDAEDEDFEGMEDKQMEEIDNESTQGVENNHLEGIHVTSLLFKAFWNRLINHFDILWRQIRIQWPSQKVSFFGFA